MEWYWSTNGIANVYMVTLAKFQLNFRQKGPLSIVNSATMHVALHCWSMQIHDTKLKMSKICAENVFALMKNSQFRWNFLRDVIIPEQKQNHSDAWSQLLQYIIK